MNQSARQSADELIFVLIGAAGSGKSSTGNSILGNKEFKVSVGTKLVTKAVEIRTVQRLNLRITVVDTPGLQRESDFTTLQADIQQKIKSSGAVRVVYIITIQIGRYTDEERQLLQSIFKKNKVKTKNAIVIFTSRSDLLDEEDPVDRILDTWIQRNPSLDKLIHENKLQYLAFENKRLIAEENDIQVRDLISTVNGMERSEGYCAVSDFKKKTNFIYVDRETMGKKFGDYGLEFYDDQELIQKEI